MKQSVLITPEYRDYLLSYSVVESTAAAAIRHGIARTGERGIQIAPEQGQLLRFLVRLLSARAVLEVGTYFGYSGLWLAEGLPDDGILVSIEANASVAAQARGYWQDAKLDHKIQLHCGLGVDVLMKLIGEKNQFDLAFIDANKEDYS